MDSSDVALCVRHVTGRNGGLGFVPPTQSRDSTHGGFFPSFVGAQGPCSNPGSGYTLQWVKYTAQWMSRKHHGGVVGRKASETLFNRARAPVSMCAV